jgi:hypothetical protein
MKRTATPWNRRPIAETCIRPPSGHDEHFGRRSVRNNLRRWNSICNVHRLASAVVIFLGAGLSTWQWLMAPGVAFLTAHCVVYARETAIIPADETLTVTPPSAAGGSTATVHDVNADSVNVQDVVIVIGAAGKTEYGEQFRSWAERWQKTALRTGAETLLIGGTDEASTAETPPPVSDRDQLQQALKARIGGSTEPLWLVLIGHGSFDGRTTSFHLRGPDVTASLLAEWCGSCQRPLVVVVCSSCSGPFLPALSGPQRIIITATRDGNQVQYSRFGDAMSLAISTLEADIDQNGQTSVLEAWLFAARRTAETYVSLGLLATEHSLLDDNGDGKGSRAELFDGVRVRSDVTAPEAIDGRISERIHLERSAFEQQMTVEQRQLRDETVQKIDDLRRRRDEFDEADYLNQLEQLLLPLSRMYESLEPSSDTAADPAAPTSETSP